MDYYMGEGRRKHITFLGRKNIAGANIKRIREMKNPVINQNDLASLLQLKGIKIFKNSISRIENGEQILSDILLKYIAEILEVPVAELLDDSIYKDSISKNAHADEENIDSISDLDNLVNYEKDPDFGVHHAAEK